VTNARLPQAAVCSCRWKRVHLLRLPARHVATLAVLVLATIVGAAPIANAAGGDGIIDQLKRDAVEALKAERALVAQPGEMLRAADDRGAVLLTELEAAGFTPSPNLLATLGHLPPKTAPGKPPKRERYDAAIRELGGDPFAPPAQTVTEPPVSTVTGPPVHTETDSGWTGAMAALAAGGAVLSALVAVVVVVLLRRHKDKRLVALAMTDSLTALHNRRRLDNDLMACSATEGQPVAVLMVDVDNFKLVNDLQGHSAGDRVLRHVGALLPQHVRPQDVVYRYGGEEFCVLLPNATEPEAICVAERIRQSTSALRIPGLEPVTVSVGVAIGTGADVVQTLERADSAMYNAKRDGRDRVAVAPETVCSGATHG